MIGTQCFDLSRQRAAAFQSSAAGLVLCTLNPGRCPSDAGNPFSDHARHESDSDLAGEPYIVTCHLFHSWVSPVSVLHPSVSIAVRSMGSGSENLPCSKKLI